MGCVSPHLLPLTSPFLDKGQVSQGLRRGILLQRQCWVEPKQFGIKYPITASLAFTIVPGVNTTRWAGRWGWRDGSEAVSTCRPLASSIHVAPNHPTYAHGGHGGPCGCCESTPGPLQGYSALNCWALSSPRVNLVKAVLIYTMAFVSEVSWSWGTK